MSLPYHCLRLRRLILLLALGAAARAQAAEPGPIERVLAELVDSGRVVGAQMIVGEGERTLVEASLGRVAPDRAKGVDAETLFCIGSTSKPVVSTIVMTLVEEGALALDDPIDKFLPRFGSLRLEGSGEAVPAPTLRQLLMHRGGVYSQKNGRMTPRQAGWIRNFRLTLKESVDCIAGERLISRPGSEYAYSGAAYCVIGRAAEVASSTSIDQLLKQRLGARLGWRRTTYFPRPADSNVASGAAPRSNGRKPHPATPHLLGDELRLPLVGGSVCSTARELARFAAMIAGRGEFAGAKVLSVKRWNEMTSPRQGLDESVSYALGWSLTIDEGARRPRRIGHNGALAASRSSLLIDLESRRYALVLYTTADFSPEVGEKIRQAMRTALEP